MTRRSASRGILYSAPPAGDDEESEMATEETTPEEPTVAGGAPASETDVETAADD